MDWGSEKKGNPQQIVGVNHGIDKKFLSNQNFPKIK